MKRFLISSPAYNGDAEIVFDTDGRLIRMDVMNTNMPPELVHQFKVKLPAMLIGLEEAFAGSKATIVEADFEFTSEDFMREYPYKRNTHLVHQHWPKMLKSDQVLAYYSAIDYRRYCERNKWYNPKIPVAWLRDKEFLNDWKKM